MVKGFGTTGGALLGGRPYPRSHNKKRVWNDMWSPVLRTLTQTRHLGARSGAWNDVRSAAWCAKWKGAVLRPYTGRLPRSPISEREANLERLGETYMELRSFEGIGFSEKEPGTFKLKGRGPERRKRANRRVEERNGTKRGPVGLGATRTCRRDPAEPDSAWGVFS